MPLDDTITAVDCIPECQPTNYLGEAEFLSLLIDRLATASGVDLADITAEDLATITEEAWCELQDRTVYYSTSPEKLRSVALYLLSQV